MSLMYGIEACGFFWPSTESRRSPAVIGRPIFGYLRLSPNLLRDVGFGAWDFGASGVFGRA